MSMSGGGVGGIVSDVGGDPHAADVAHEGGALVQVGDVVGRVTGGVGDLEAPLEERLATAQDAQVRLGTARNSPHRRSMSSP